MNSKKELATEYAIKEGALPNPIYDEREKAFITGYDARQEKIDALVEILQKANEYFNMINSNFNNIAESTKHITSGNVSHNSKIIEGKAKRNFEFIMKNWINNEEIQEILKQYDNSSKY